MGSWWHSSSKTPQICLARNLWSKKKLRHMRFKHNNNRIWLISSFPWEWQILIESSVLVRFEVEVWKQNWLLNLLNRVNCDNHVNNFDFFWMFFSCSYFTCSLFHCCCSCLGHYKSFYFKSLAYSFWGINFVYFFLPGFNVAFSNAALLHV